jgi:hypothetical protein
MSEGFEAKSGDATKNYLRGRKSAELADIGSIQQSVVEQFAEIKDPRVERTRETSTGRHLSNCDSGSHSGSAGMGRYRELRH